MGKRCVSVRVKFVHQWKVSLHGDGSLEKYHEGGGRVYGALGSFKHRQETSALSILLIRKHESSVLGFRSLGER